MATSRASSALAAQPRSSPSARLSTWSTCSSSGPTSPKTCNFAGAGVGKPQIGLAARPASRSYEGRCRRHTAAEASPVFAISASLHLVDLLVLGPTSPKTCNFAGAGAGKPQIGLAARPASRSYEGRRRRLTAAEASPVFASCASIAGPGSLPRNQKTAGFSRLSSFAGQAGLVEPACTCADQRGRRTCAGAVLADLELTQVRKGRTCEPARSARHARPRLGSGWLLSCRSSAAHPRFGLADRRSSSRAGHERRHPSSTATTCERTSARA